MKRGKSPITQEKLKRFIVMAKAGVSLDDIAEELNIKRVSITVWSRSKGADYFELSRTVPSNRPISGSVNAGKTPKKPRKCLSCQKEFQSWGAGNRMCRQCKVSPPMQWE